jgi:ATP-dependent helicase/nuclease subunit A
MSDQDIYTIVKTNNFNLTNTYKKVKNVVDNFSDSSTYEILDALFDEFELYDKIITLGNYSSNAHIAEIFLNLVKDMDKLGFSIDEVVSYFDEIDEYNLEIDFTDNQSVDNSVTLMTMHKSKGLEFPFVYLAGLIKEFNHADTKAKVIVNSEYGVILPPTGDFEFNNLSTHLYKEKYIQADYEERLRLLYVAMTRAKERLILVIGIKENEKEIYDITKVNSFASLMKATPFYNKCKINIPYGNSQLMFKWAQIPPKNIEFKEICINPGGVISKNKASKQVSEGVDQSLLDFGNRIHQLLEVVNIETKDVSYIKNKNEQKYICNVINSSIFEGVKNDQVRHEFKFFNNVNNLNGVIDALIIKDNEIDIIDFKLKNLDDEAYVKQLYSYRDYISTISTKKIKLYLIAALTGEVKEIE